MQSVNVYVICLVVGMDIQGLREAWAKYWGGCSLVRILILCFASIGVVDLSIGVSKEEELMRSVRYPVAVLLISLNDIFEKRFAW